MPDPEVRIPSDLGLSEEQIRSLIEGFRNQVADVVNDTRANAAASARPHISGPRNVATVKIEQVIDA